MFCAKCGSELALGDGDVFICPRGLEYSVDLTRRLRERYSAAVTPISVATYPPDAGRWFCPGCGGALASPEQSCGACGIPLSMYIAHPLIELHPHPDERGGFF